MSVKLKSHHLEQVIEIVQRIIEYKFQALRKPSWERFEQEYLPPLVEQIHFNEFKCNRADQNTMIWLIDQVCWSRELIEGVPHKEGRPLSDLPLGQEVIEICRAAAKGQVHYDSWSSESNFRNLFT